jgi:hypothetical protein
MFTVKTTSRLSPYTNTIANLDPLDIFANFDSLSNNFMANDCWIIGWAPSRA